MKIKILVTGANGQLGLTFQKKHNSISDVLEFHFTSRITFDICNSDQVNAYFTANQFDYCINCAAFTNVELAESEIEEAFHINAEGVKTLSLSCKKHKVILIHISTDYVFDGTKKTPYLEEDQTHPLNQYGKSKLRGEHYIKEILSDFFIIRTSWLYSPYGKNFAKTITSKLQNNEALKIVTSETGTPTSCLDLAEFILYLIKTKSKSFGLYHFSASGETTWYGFAMEIAEQMKKSELLSKVDTFPMKAKRPKYSVLNNHKAFSLMNTSFRWQTSVNSTISELLSS